MRTRIRSGGELRSLLPFLAAWLMRMLVQGVESGAGERRRWRDVVGRLSARTSRSLIFCNSLIFCRLASPSHCSMLLGTTSAPWLDLVSPERRSGLPRPPQLQ